MEMLCPWESPQFLIFSSNIPTLLYYSHFIAILAAIIFALALIGKVRESSSARWFLASIVLFCTWAVLDVLLWASNRPDIVLFYWNLQILLEILLYTAAFCFAYVFITKKEVSFVKKIGIAILMAPVLVLLPTGYVLEGIDIAYCNALESSFIVMYSYAFEIFFSLCLLFVAFRQIHREGARAKEVGFFTLGILVFLLAFSSGNIIGSVTEDWALAQVGLFGMPVFIGFLAYTSVRFRTFNLKVFGAQALVIALWLLTLSQLFIRTLGTIQIIVAVNLVMFTILGYFLIKNVRREIEQREHIEMLAKDLEVSNARQVTLIHFITHQIKGFVTKSKYVFASLLEGDMGPLPEPLKPMVQEGLRSNNAGLNTIQEILNASNIKSGKVEYTMAPFDLKALIEEIATGLKDTAEHKGLALNLALNDATVNGDRAQLINVFKNLIDNSIKYTPSGSVTVSLTKEGTKVLFKVEDTGVGITPEDMKNLFTEGGHGKDSQKVNVESTGFGLYIVKNIVVAHHGRVWAESDGAGKGSRFIVELPA